MELINKKYILVNKYDIYKEQLRANEQNDKLKIMYFNKLLHAFREYEREERIFIKDIYIDKDSVYAKKYINLDKIPITRQTIINAMLIAMINDEINIALKLKPLIYENEYLATDLGDMLDYVLEHNLEVIEYLNGENPKIIYNEETNDFEKGYIYNNSQFEKSKKLIK